MFIKKDSEDNQLQSSHQNMSWYPNHLPASCTPLDQIMGQSGSELEVSGFLQLSQPIIFGSRMQSFQGSMRAPMTQSRVVQQPDFESQTSLFSEE